MTFHNYLKASEKLVIDNSPAILTGVGVVGTLATAYLTGTATVKAERILREDAYENHGNVFFQHDIKDRARMTWKVYIPPAITATGTVAAIVGANRIGTRRMAALAAAYTISEKAYSEYREKVTEHLGKNKEQKVRDEIQQDRVNDNPSTIVLTGDSSVLCYDKFSGRYFESSMEDLKWAQNSLNHTILNSYYASLNDFYNLIGMHNVSVGEEVGWNLDELMELEFTTVMSENNKPCLAIDFRVTPIRGYHRIN